MTPAQNQAFLRRDDTIAQQVHDALVGRPATNQTYPEDGDSAEPRCDEGVSEIVDTKVLALPGYTVPKCATLGDIVRWR